MGYIITNKLGDDLFKNFNLKVSDITNRYTASGINNNIETFNESLTPITFSDSSILNSLKTRYFDVYSNVSHLFVNRMENDVKTLNPLYYESTILKFEKLDNDIHKNFENKTEELYEQIPINDDDNYTYNYQELLRKYGDNKLSNTYSFKKEIIDKFSKIFGESSDASFGESNSFSNGNLRGARGRELLITDNIVSENCPFYKVEKASADTNIYLVLRGIPILLDRFETSVTKDGYNYIFRYPEYILNDASLLRSIEKVYITNNDCFIFKGLKDSFGYSGITDNFTDKTYNLNIINNLNRNKKQG